MLHISANNLIDLNNYYAHTISLVGSDFSVVFTIISTYQYSYSSTTNIYNDFGSIKVPASGSIKFSESLGIVNGVAFVNRNNGITLYYMNASGNNYSAGYTATSFRDTSIYRIE